MGEAVVLEPRMEIPEEMKGPAVREMLATFWLTTLLGFIEKFGTKESMDVLMPLMENIGRSKAESMLRVIPKLEPNAMGYAAWTHTWEEMLGIEGYLEEAGPDRVIKVATKCPFAEQGSDPIICECMSASLKGSATVIAPDFHWRLTHNLTKGDKVCRWVIERKK